MSKSPDGLRSAVGMLPKARAPVTEPADDKPRGDDRGMIRQTLYLPAAIHEQFRELAHAKRVTQQELFRRASNLLFEQEGLPSWGELQPSKKRA